ncbi:MAG: phage baseplate assembly protein [Myxococcales bacterium]|nr:phage baseplate assembly protein [Myxococcales bacterium]
MSALREQMLKLVAKATAPIKTRVNNMLVRTVVAAINDDTGFQQVTTSALAGELPDQVEHMQPGGLSHVALPTAEGLMVCIGGSRSHAIALMLANRSMRPKGLLPGETAIWTAGPSPLGGLKILCKADGSIEVTPGGITPVMKIAGDLEVTGEVTAKAGVGTGVGLSTHITPSPMGPLGPPTPGT